MNYLDALKEEANATRTLNGAKAYRSSGDACLDLFSVAGGIRYRKPADQIALFDRAYIENPSLAMKLLFHIRDVRGGMGERKLFRTLLRHVAKVWPESAEKNVRHIAEYGRWDDLLCLLGTPAQDEAVSVIRQQLDADLKALEQRTAGDLTAHISLLAKWMPSINTSSHRTRQQAQRLCRLLVMDEYRYRKTLAALRAHIGLTERYLTRGTPEKVQYHAVPAGAMLKYRSAFRRRDGQRFSSFLKEVANGKARLHADTIFPYEICRPYFKDCASEDATLEVLWRAMSHEAGNRNALSVIDTSGSMYWSMGSLKPALISQAMGIYCAERCQGLFHNVFITFESHPHLMELKGETLRDKLRWLQTAPWGGSTNLEAVFELILSAAVKANASQEEMPDVLYIFSDMEFNVAFRNPDKSVYENARELFAAFGYQLPAVVFHNVNSWQMQTPVTARTRGAAMTSGASISALREKFDGNVTPLDHMLRVLNGKRYEPITA